jgi:predicted dehydrogenase
MFRIGILGTENSHAAAFTKIFNAASADGKFEYPDMKVVMIGGNYADQNAALAAKYNLAVAENPLDMLGKVDALMVTARDGKYHAGFARPFIEAGLPVFVDKPFTSDPDEALELVRLAKKKGVPLSGGSSVKYAPDVVALRDFVAANEIHGGSIAAPLNMVNEYGGFWFYSSHLTEIMLTIFGYNPESVYAQANKNDITVIAKYGKYSVSNHFNDGCKTYFAAAYSKTSADARVINIETCYKSECDVFANMLRTGHMDQPYSELIAPVYYIDAVKRSYETGASISLKFPEV